jgi:hypothetical protein
MTMSPGKREGPAARPGPRQAAPATPVEVTGSTVTRETVTWLAAMTGRRQDAARRLPPLECGCRDPLICDLRRGCPYWDGPRRWRAAS